MQVRVVVQGILLEEVGLGWNFAQGLERWKRDLGTHSWPGDW